MDTPSNQNRATEKFLAGYNCAQAVLHAASDRLGLDRDAALRLACGFGAGMGRTEEVCGAVTGGIIAIGLKFGRGEGEDRAKTEETYARTRAFMAAFKEQLGSVICRDLIRCDLLTTEGQAYFKENDLLHRTCVRCVETADRLLQEGG